MSGIDYYSFSGQIVPQTNPNVKVETELNMPTAPMYRDLETYNGRCAVWLKHIGISGDTGIAQVAQFIRDFLNETTPIFVMKGCASLNQMSLKANKGNNFIDGTTSQGLTAGSVRTEARGGFRDATFLCPFNTNHLELTNADGIEQGDIYHQVAREASATAGIPDARNPPLGDGSGDGTQGNAPAHTIMIDNAKFFTEYYNHNVGNMGEAVIVNNLWGSSINFALEGLKKNKFFAGQVVPLRNYEADVNFEIVVKPLKNEPIYRGLPDEKD